MISVGRVMMMLRFEIEDCIIYFGALECGQGE